MQSKKQFSSLKEEQGKNKDKIKALEKSLLEKEFELKDIENEKQIKSQD